MDIGIAQRPARGEEVCGDGFAVARLADAALICVIDGLGHGAEAHVAAEMARRAALAHAHLDLPGLAAMIDRELVGTRGAALGLVRLSVELELVCGAIGNVEISGGGTLRLHSFSTPGIVGRKAPRLRVGRSLLTPGDRVFVYTDGVSRRFKASAFAALSAQPAAEAILAGHGAMHDDATCVVIDC